MTPSNNTTELLARWEARALNAAPVDSMIVNRHIRELREALAAAPAQPGGLPAGMPEPVASVYTMEALVPGGEPKCHVSLNQSLTSGTKLYTADQVQAMLAAHVPVAAFDRLQSLADFQAAQLLAFDDEGEKPSQEYAELVLANLDALKDDAAVHIFPSDLHKCETSECVVKVCSVRVGSPDENSVPLFSRAQVAVALADATLALRMGGKHA